MPHPIPKLTRGELFQFLLAVCGILFLILIFLVRQKPYFTIDLEITQAIQSFQQPFFGYLMNLLTYLGNFLPFTSLCVVTFFILRFYHQIKASVYLVVSVLGTVGISSFFKLLVARPRPNPSIIHQASQFNNADSFPSQHVLEYIGLFGFLLFLSLIRLKSKTRLFTSLILIFLLSTIGLSRIYLGAHWFSDVVGSYLIGFVWLGLIIRLYRRAQ